MSSQNLESIEHDDNDHSQCPLCMETLDWDDLGFFPCSCGYQICTFCWHRLRTEENGLCPACRQAFPDIPVSFNQEISAEELKRQKKRNKERRSNKDQAFRPQDLATLRVVQKNLVFVIGLSSRLTQEDLKKEFAHFGKIIKFVHNKSTAYITYSKPEEAIRAIRTLNASAAHENAVQQLQFQSQLTNGTSATALLQASNATTLATNNNSITNHINNNIINTTTNNNSTTTINNNTVAANLNAANSFLNAMMSVPIPPNQPRLKASLGTTKYCNHFLRSQQCPKVGECMYLHEVAEAKASFTKEQMQAGKHVEYEKKLMDSYLAKLEWQANLASQNNGYRVTQNNLPIQQINNHHHHHQQQQQQSNQQQTIAQQISSHIASATTTTTAPTTNSNQLSPTQNSNQVSFQNFGLVRQNNNTSSPTSSTTPTLSSPVIQILSDNSPNQLLRQQQQLSPLQPQQPHQTVITNNNASHQNREVSERPPSLGLEHHHAQQLRHHPKQPENQTLLQKSTSHSRQQQPLNLDTDSEDDGLDFDPISVSTSGLRDLLDQQVQQAKQLQLNYLQQLNSNPTLANALFQQTANRLNQQQQQGNGLIGTDAATTSTSNTTNQFNGHPQSIASLVGFDNTTTNSQQQMTWQNLGAWTSFLQRSGYGFENSR